jgi:hypothetical protein
VHPNASRHQRSSPVKLVSRIKHDDGYRRILARLLARRPKGIFLSEYERGEIGPDLFRQACKFGLEGLMSKRCDRPYCARRHQSLKPSHLRSFEKRAQSVLRRLRSLRVSQLAP